MSSTTPTTPTTTTTTIFLTSATGTQGLNLARRLRALNYSVNATTRDLSSPASQTLLGLGVNLTQASWDDEPGLRSALSGCAKMFLNTIITFADPPAERVQFRRLLTLAREAGVKQAVYSSAGSLAEIQKHLADFESEAHPIMLASLRTKQDNEAALRDAGFESWTVLRGANFMENWLDPKVAMYQGFKESGTLRLAVPADVRIPLVDTDDIARFAVEVFGDPERFNGQDVNIVSDELTLEQVLASLAAKTGREFRFEPISDEQLRIEKETNPFVTAGLVLRHMGKFMKKEETDKWNVIKTTGFDEFLDKSLEAVRRTYLL